MIPDSLTVSGGASADWMDLLDKGASILSAIVSLVGVIVSMRALKISRQTALDQQQARLAERREQRFAQMVSQRALAAVNDFTTQILPLLQDCEREVTALDPSRSQQEFIQLTARSVHRFNRIYYDVLRAPLLGVVNAWSDNVLQHDMEIALEWLQDELTKAIERYADPRERGGSLAALVHRGVSDIMRIIVSYDAAREQLAPIGE